MRRRRTGERRCERGREEHLETERDRDRARGGPRLNRGHLREESAPADEGDRREEAERGAPRVTGERGVEEARREPDPCPADPRCDARRETARQSKPPEHV